MANEKPNKVIYGGNTIIDLTNDTVTPNSLLAGATAHDASGSAISGSMPNQGTKTASLNAGQSYTIPEGYHSGSGVVTANSLASQTVGTATANEILSGFTAWVNGTKLTGTATSGGATITVTYNSSFYNKTITCSNGTKTYTKTTTSSGSTVFNVSDEGTWTITCNGVSRTVNVVLNYTTQMAITKTVTVYGAAGATISYTDTTGSKTVTLNNSGQGSASITFIPPSATITFTDTNVSKNPNDLTQNYSKSITITESTTSIKVMPDNSLYWWGWMARNDAIVAGALTPTFNVTSVYATTNGGWVKAFTINQPSNITAQNIIFTLDKKSAQGMYRCAFPTSTSYITAPANTIQNYRTTVVSSSDLYLFEGSIYLYAVLYE